jgi:hypothetical protein
MAPGRIQGYSNCLALTHSVVITSQTDSRSWFVSLPLLLIPDTVAKQAIWSSCSCAESQPGCRDRAASTRDVSSCTRFSAVIFIQYVT